MKASDIMTREIVTITPDMALEKALKLMVEHHLSGLPVVDGGESLVGILTEGDLLRRAEIGTEDEPSWLASVFTPGRAAGKYVRANGRTVGDLMTWPVVSVAEDEPLSKIVATMESRDIKRVPVVKEGRLVGMVTRADLVKAVLQMLSEESGGQVSDIEMKRCLRAKLANLGWVPRFGVDVNVQDGVVELFGIISDERERTALRVLAANAEGAKGVRDNLTCVEPLSGVVIDGAAGQPATGQNAFTK